MAEKIINFSKVAEALAEENGRSTRSKLSRAFRLAAREDAFNVVMGETDEHCFFTDKELPGKGLLSKIFGPASPLYCTEAAFQGVVARSGLAPAAKEAALKAAGAAPDHEPDRAKGNLEPYPGYIGFHG